MKRELRNAFRRLRWLIVLGGFAGAMGCATVDVKRSAKACADVTAEATARDIAPKVAEAIACAVSTDAGAEACAKMSLLELEQTTSAAAFTCALAKIHDQTIP